MRSASSSLSDRLKSWNTLSPNAQAYVIMVACCALVTGTVATRAWVSEDSFITFRYVANTLAGHGAVFNVGERVQGYTHPLWFLLLVAGCFVFGNPIYVAAGYGILLTLLMLVVWSRTLIRVSDRPLAASGLTTLVCLVFVSSDPWTSFQTGGLENPLSHLLLTLIAIECWTRGASRPAVLTLSMCLLCLARPDFVFFCAPLGVLVLARVRSWRALVRVLLATVPAAAWLAFAWTYYGDIVPNSARAKMAIYPDGLYSARMGWTYLLDWLVHDRTAAVATPLFLAYVVPARRGPPVLACVFGALIYALWIVWVGGDFMRGRLFLPVLTTSLVLGSMALASDWRSGSRKPLLAASILALVLAALFVWDRVAAYGAEEDMDFGGIVNERECYPGYSLRFYLRHERLASPWVNLGFAEDLKAYAEAFGPIAIHFRNPGTIGYFAGPKVTVIDTVGLTDRFIAHLSREYSVDPRPRPGHPERYIPIAYLVSRGDVSILPGWYRAILDRDGSLKKRLREYEGSELLIDSWGNRFDPNVLEKNRDSLPRRD